MNRKVTFGLTVGIVVLTILVVQTALAGSTSTGNGTTWQATYQIAPAGKASGKLSFRLAELAGSAALRAASADDQARALSLAPEGPGSLVWNSHGQLLVYIRMADLSEAQLQAVQTAGAQITHVSDRYRVVTAFVDASRLSSLAKLAAVQSIEEALTPMAGSRASGVPPARVKSPVVISCPQGAAVTEGDVQLKANQARSTYQLDGTGVKVGILSDSFDKNPSALTDASGDIATGDLPGPGNPCGQLTAVNVISESLTNQGDEGRAMLQLVHDVAPTATLSFASAFNGLFQFADNIRSLRTAGADIIADDVFYFIEPFFQEGPINVAISDVVHSGALYFALAGNNNYIIGGKNVSSYEAPQYRPTACPTITNLGYTLLGNCHDFNPGGGVDATSAITLANNGSVYLDLQWKEPWYGVTDDIDVILINSSNQAVAGSVNINLTTQTPYEFFSFVNTTGTTQRYRIVINRYSGTGTPRLKYIFLQGTGGVQGVQYNTSSGGDIVGPTLYGHSATVYGLSVAAVPYNNSNVPENYTSRGPAAHYFGPVVNTLPAASISPATINQPDFAATDGGCTTFFGGFSSGCYRFYGTSAATPHAAAVAALLKQEASQLHIALTPALAKFLLQTTAQSVSGGGADSTGAGLIDALSAVQKLASFQFSVFLPLIIR